MPSIHLQAVASGAMLEITKLEKNATKMPNTILNWNRPVSLPLSPAGDISEINKGAAIVDIPMPMPPMKRNIKNDETSHATADPKAPIKKSMPFAIKVFLRPYFFCWNTAYEGTENCSP